MRRRAVLHGARFALALLAFIASVASTPASAATFLQYVSEPGDRVGQGISGTLTEDTATRFTAFSSDPFVRVDAGYWTFFFQNGTLQPLAPGAYENAFNASNGVTGVPGLSVTWGGWACYRSRGRFIVHEVVYGAGSTVTSFAADFEQRCDNSEPALYGGIRLNSSLPYVAPPPPARPPAHITLHSAPGEYIAQGQELLVDRTGGWFKAGSSQDKTVVYISKMPPTTTINPIWAVALGAQQSHVLQPGVYEGATKFGYPVVDILGERRCATTTGRFTVLEVEYGPQDSVTRFAADFEQRCDGAAPVLSGSVRFNSAIPDSAPAPAVATRLNSATGIEDYFALALGSSNPPPLTVRASDAGNYPIAGARVVWDLGPCGVFSGGGGSRVTLPTDTRGISQVPAWVAATRSQRCEVSATLESVPAARVSTYFYVYEASDVVIEPVPSASVATRPNGMLMLLVYVRLQPLPPYAAPILIGVPVEFRVQSTGAAGVSILPAHIDTDAFGKAGVIATANGFEGTYAIVVSSQGASTTISVVQGGPSIPPPVPASPVRQQTGTSPGGSAITLSLSSPIDACTFTSASFTDARAASLPIDKLPGGLTLPYGLLLFDVVNCGAGRAVDFTVDYGQPLPATATYWKYGRTPDNGAVHWYSLPARVDGNKMTFTIVDGSLGDDDLTANGAISDPGGVAVAGGTYQDLWWSGIGENGWGMSIIQHRDLLFTNVYAYDNQAKPVWYVMPSGTWNAAHTAFAGALYLPKSAPFFAYDVSRFDIGAQVGTATLTFSDPNTGAFDYTINGVAGRKNITRIPFGPPDSVAKAPVTDLWWGGTSQNGWGIAVLQQYSTLFSLWFTYDANGAATWYVMPGGSWSDGSTYEGRIYRAVGPQWLGKPYDASQHRTIDVGSFRLRFTGDAASFEYTVDGRGGTLPLSRVPF